MLLSTKGIDVNFSSVLGMTALMGSAQKGHLECVKLLLQADGIDVMHRSLNGKTAGDVAASEEIKALILEHVGAGAGAIKDVD